jgi:hypothetical protein
MTWPAMQAARRVRSVRLVAAAAGDYAAADVISNSVTDTLGLPNRVIGVVNNAGDLAILDYVNVTCSEDSVLFRLRLHWYNYRPLPADVEMDDNIAADWAKISAGREGYVGYTDIPAFADRGTAMAQAQSTNLRQLLKTEATDQYPATAPGDLWYVVEALDAEANETAGMIFDFDFGFLN